MLGTSSPTSLRAKCDNNNNVIEEDTVVTLKEFLESQRKLELQAAEALPFRFDKCSAELGPLRQNLHICHGCPFTNNRPLAFCYACAITCHNFEPSSSFDDHENENENVNDNTNENKTYTKNKTSSTTKDENIDDVFGAYGDDKDSDTDNENINDNKTNNNINHNETDNNNDDGSNNSGHEIEEIWSRRNFICDCPSTNHCKLLNPQALSSSHANHRNSRHSLHNFRGRYCLCEGRGWAVGDRTMYQCEICEDWFHDVCVARNAHKINNNTFIDQSEIEVSELEIPDEDSFTDFICKSCVEINSSFFLKVLLNDQIFTFPPQEILTISQFGPLFLADGWRISLQAQEKDLRVSADALNISHLLLAEKEPVYEPEVDTDAKESLYDRKKKID